MLQDFFDPPDEPFVLDTTTGGSTSPLTRTDRALTALYGELIDHPDTERAHLISDQRTPEQLDQLLDALVHRGLVTLAGDVVQVVPPDTALPAQALQLERRAAEARSAVGELARRYYLARTETTRHFDQLLRLLYSHEEMGAALAEIVSTGVDQVVTMRAPTQRILTIGALTPELRSLPFVNAKGQILPTRAIYDTRLMQAVPAGTSTLVERSAFEDQRMCRALPWTVTVVDDRAAIIDIGFPGRGAPAGLLMRTPVLVEPVLWLVERFWDFSMPIPRAGVSNSLEKRDQHILGMLASGASDATIARQMGVSQRTVERRIKVILDQLGAQSRFQAGMLAKERGWL